MLSRPWHSVRETWNMAAVCKHCKETGETLFICPAEDRIVVACMVTLAWANVGVLFRVPNSDLKRHGPGRKPTEPGRAELSRHDGLRLGLGIIQAVSRRPGPW